MADRKAQFDARAVTAWSRTGRWGPTILAGFLVFGGIYGAAVGAAVHTTEGAAATIGIAAAVIALICGLPASRFGFIFAAYSRARFGRWTVGLLAATVGTILGGFLGLIAIMPFGAIPGAVGGWLLARAVLRRGFFKRLLGQGLGWGIGLCIGVLILALNESPATALLGIAWGSGLGLVLGALPPLLVAKLLDSLVPRRYSRGTVIDTTVVDVRDGETGGATMLSHEAYDEGYDAYWDGVDESGNPFKEEDEPENGRQWNAGWRKARVDDYDERE